MTSHPLFPLRPSRPCGPLLILCGMWPNKAVQWTSAAVTARSASAHLEGRAAMKGVEAAPATDRQSVRPSGERRESNAPAVPEESGPASSMTPFIACGSSRRWRGATMLLVPLFLLLAGAGCSKRAISDAVHGNQLGSPPCSSTFGFAPPLGPTSYRSHQIDFRIERQRCDASTLGKNAAVEKVVEVTHLSSTTKPPKRRFGLICCGVSMVSGHAFGLMVESIRVTAGTPDPQSRPSSQNGSSRLPRGRRVWQSSSCPRR